MADEKKAGRGNPTVRASGSGKDARKNAMRSMAVQGVANSQGIDARIEMAKQAAGNPLRSSPASAASTSMVGATSPAPASQANSNVGANEAAVAAVVPHVATARGEYKLVPMAEIDENPFNARKTYRETRVKEMSASLAANGQEVPGIATIRNGRHVLAAGHYRFKGLHLLDAPYMALMVIPGMTDKQLYEHSYRENAEREDQTAWDNALAWYELLAKKIYTSEQELAAAVGMSPANVNKTLASLRLSEAVREVVTTEPSKFALSVLYQLSLFENVGGSDRTVEFAKRVLAEEIGRKEIEEARARLQKPQQRKPREQSRQYNVRVGEGGGFLKEFPNGKVTFEVNILDPQARAEFVEQLRKQYEVQS